MFVSIKQQKQNLLDYERQLDLKWKLKDVLEYCTLPQLVEIKKIMEDKYKFIIYEELDKKSLSNLNEDRKF